MELPKNATEKLRIAAGIALAASCLSACGADEQATHGENTHNSSLRCVSAGFFSDYGNLKHNGDKAQYGLELSVMASDEYNTYNPVNINRAVIEEIGGPFKKSIHLRDNQAPVTIPSSVHRYIVEIHKGKQAATCGEEMGIPRETGGVHDQVSSTEPTTNHHFATSGK